MKSPDSIQVNLLKAIKWDLLNKENRIFYIQFLIRNLPGRFGFELRRRHLHKNANHVGKNVVIHEGVRIRNIKMLTVGANVRIGVNNFFQAAGGIILSDNVLLGPDVKIWSANHIYKDLNRPIVEQGYKLDKVCIGKNVWIGSNSFILPGAKIGDNVIIAAGSVVLGKKIPTNIVIAGNPAVQIGKREERE